MKFATTCTVPMAVTATHLRKIDGDYVELPCMLINVVPSADAKKGAIGVAIDSNGYVFTRPIDKFRVTKEVMDGLKDSDDDA